MMPERPSDRSTENSPESSLDSSRKRQADQYFPYLFIILIFASVVLNILCLAGVVGRGAASAGLIAVMAGNIINLFSSMKDPLNKQKKMKNSRPFILLYISAGLLWLVTYLVTLL